MAKVLYVEASPRKQRSASIEVCEAFLERYRAKNPSDEIEKLDIGRSIFQPSARRRSMPNMPVCRACR